ncbi:hypothetical protein SLEP1_g20934 [Rubroshorea leprosula]|uniref:Reverse transcriptase domain-containing protein n=1 Tax=Rubroshorea leprosula TaxID=152421 RepID=A0AAV5J4A4_9ROSI|nr:hypothetical protein SLEP1_g20934 [Rubroshorea leprosula]
MENHSKSETRGPHGDMIDFNGHDWRRNKEDLVGQIENTNMGANLKFERNALDERYSSSEQLGPHMERQQTQGILMDPTNTNNEITVVNNNISMELDHGREMLLIKSYEPVGLDTPHNVADKQSPSHFGPIPLTQTGATGPLFMFSSAQNTNPSKNRSWKKDARERRHQNSPISLSSRRVKRKDEQSLIIKSGQTGSEKRGKGITVRCLIELVGLKKPAVVFLCETLLDIRGMEKVRRRLGFRHCFVVDRVGRSGGLAMLWNPDIQLSLLSYSQNHIDMEVEGMGSSHWRFTSYYGHLERHNCKRSWLLLRDLAAQSALPWLISGDFNDLLHLDEKLGGTSQPNWMLHGFKEVVDACDLAEVQMVGGQFTWRRGGVKEKLDRGTITRDKPGAKRDSDLRRCGFETPAVRKQFNLAGLLSSAWVIGPPYCKRCAFVLRTSNDGILHILAMYRNGEWKHKFEELQVIATTYFSSLFSSTAPSSIEQVTSCLCLRVTIAANDFLLQPFMEANITEALYQMHPTKALGPDGLSPSFFQCFWSIVKDDIVKPCLDFLNNGGVLPHGLNFTHIVLISKCNEPTTMADLRPISLCNVIYRILAKGRRKRGWQAIKLDMSKAFDRVEWPYLEQVIHALGFAERWIRLIMECVSSVTYEVLLNGKEVGQIIPSRGLRQGDPLLPYLFILCAEGLTAMIHKADNSRSLHSIQICRSAPKVFHLFFVDDSLLFLHAIETEAANLMAILQAYEQASGQVINLQKSSITFSSNVQPRARSRISHILGIKEVDSPGRYLGFPADIGRSRIATFSTLKSKFWAHIAEWREQPLSRAGREVLIKSVLQSLPTYVMGLFLLPKAICTDLELIMNRYWWGGGEDEHKIHWMEWRKLAISKKSRGLGFCAMREFNLSMLGKQVWRLLMHPNSLAARIMKARYFPRSTILRVELKSPCSVTWLSIWHSIELLNQGCRRLIETNSWMRDLVLETFNAHEARLILAIPLSWMGREDSWMWNFTKHGCYSVRSGYHRAMDLSRNHAGPSVSSSSFGGNRIWSLDIPEKVRLLTWSAYRNVVPTKDNLHKKCVDIDLECPMCGVERESVFHCFMSCSIARAVCRNDALWNNKGPNPHHIIKRSLDFQMEYKKALMSKGRGAAAVQRVSETRWHPPDEGYVKVNVDGAVSEQGHIFGMGALARDHHGEVLATMVCQGQGAVEAEMAEACSLRRALLWAQMLTLRRIEVETDCAAIVLAINNRTLNMNSSLGIILLDCRALMSYFVSCRLKHVRRTGNAVAHELARRALTIEADQFWVEDIPDTVAHFVTGDRPYS